MRVSQSEYIDIGTALSIIASPTFDSQESSKTEKWDLRARTFLLIVSFWWHEKSNLNYKNQLWEKWLDIKRLHTFASDETAVLLFDDRLTMSSVVFLNDLPKLSMSGTYHLENCNQQQMSFRKQIIGC